MHTEATPQARSESTDWFKQQCRDKNYQTLANLYLSSTESPYHKPTVGFFRNLFAAMKDEGIIEIMDDCDRFDPDRFVYNDMMKPDTEFNTSVWLEPWCLEIVPESVWRKLGADWWLRDAKFFFYEDDPRGFNGIGAERWRRESNVEVGVRNRAGAQMALCPERSQLRQPVEQLRQLLPDPKWVYDRSYNGARKLMESKIKQALRALG